MDGMVAEGWQALIACVVGGYLIGSIPFGLIAARLGGVGDIRKVGSGNIGATNVLRTGRRDLALITLLGDAGKGAISVLLGFWLVSHLGGVIAGGGAFLGHLYSVWLRFKGGKGVATFYGILFAVAWPVGLICGAVWLAIAGAFRFSSLAALTAAVAAPIAMFLLRRGDDASLVLALGMMALIFLKHRPNIERLRRGEEPKIGQPKEASA